MDGPAVPKGEWRRAVLAFGRADERLRREFGRVDQGIAAPKTRDAERFKRAAVDYERAVRTLNREKRRHGIVEGTVDVRAYDQDRSGRRTGVSAHTRRQRLRSGDEPGSIVDRPAFRRRMTAGKDRWVYFGEYPDGEWIRGRFGAKGFKASSAAVPDYMRWHEADTGGGMQALSRTEPDGSYYLITDYEDPGLPVRGRTAVIGFYGSDGAQVWARKIPEFTTAEEAFRARSDLRPVDLGR